VPSAARSDDAFLHRVGGRTPSPGVSAVATGVGDDRVRNLADPDWPPDVPFRDFVDLGGVRS